MKKFGWHCQEHYNHRYHYGFFELSRHNLLTKSQIHVDDYKLRLYQSLRENPGERYQSGFFPAHEGPVLAGYQCGNTPQVGCLTDDINVRIHSCEKGMHCQAINEKTVWIRPIVTRTRAGVEIGEMGVGGGGGDLTRRPELELDGGFMIDQFLGLYVWMKTSPIRAD